jgi:20S proteasome subunit beta 4
MRGPQLYWIDKMGALQEVPFGAHGHASRFVLSVLDTCCTDVDGNSFNLSLEEAVDAMRACVEQLEKRFAINSQGFSMQVVDRDGCRSLPFERN